jgi:dipeptidyl aminopeptidase/acylaminoacyl peptidase
MMDVDCLLARRLLFGNPRRARLKLSPDGESLSYLMPVDGILNIAVTPASDADSPEIVSSARRDILEYFWLGTSRHIAFFSDSAGEEDHALHLVDVAQRRTRILTQVSGVQARLAGLSPKHPEALAIAINDRNPEFHDICWVDIETGVSRRILKNDRFSSLVLDWSLEPRIGVETHANGSETWCLRDGLENWRPLLSIGMDDAIATRPLGLSEDGSVLYLTDSRHGDTAKLCQFALATGALEVLASDPLADVDAVKLHPISGAPDAVAFCRTRRIWRPIAENVAQDLQTLAGVAGEDFEIVSATADDQRWIVEANADSAPKNYFLFDRPTSVLTRIFTSRPELEGAVLAHTTPEIVRSKDGLELVVYLTFPTAAPMREGSPTVFLLHGGPWARDRIAYDAQRQWLANRGYLVVNVNFRGSTGFGKRFLNAGNREWGGRIIDDLDAVAAWVVARGLAQSEKIGLMGMSFGGYAGLMAIARPETPFACCVSLAGPPDLLALLGSLPRHWQSQFSLFSQRVGNPDLPNDRRLLEAHSPLSHLDQFNRPMLLAHGVRDIRVRIEQVRSFADALAARGTPVTLVEYPSEGHGLVGQRNRLSYMAFAEAFFAAHLGGALQAVEDDLRDADYSVRIGSQHIPALARIDAA